MNLRVVLPAGLDVHKLQHGIKWTVYTLLIINFGYYFAEDWNRAMHTLGPGSGFLDWTEEFATTIDEAGWFILLFMFELETYVLEDESWTGRVARIVRGVRIVCYAMIAHTVYAYLVAAMTLQSAVVVEDVSDLCGMTDSGVSYVYNLQYTEVSAETCSQLSAASQFYWLEEGSVVSDRAGLRLERQLAWVDLAEAIIWLLILAAIEIVVRLQDRGVTKGVLMSVANRSQSVLYLTLIGIAVYWATLGHWLYFWDELVWIGGFAAIEMNLSEWRDELLDERTAHG